VCLSDGGTVIVERGGTRLEPLSGQFVLNFEMRELNETVRVMTGRSADEWLAVALEYESEGKTGPKRSMRMSERFAWTRHGPTH